MDLFNNILLVIEDTADDHAAALGRAFTLAQNNQARLSVLAVREQPRLGPFAGSLRGEDVRERLEQRELERLDALLASQPEAARLPRRVRFGTPFVEVIRTVLSEGHDLVIKASGYGGAHSFLFGSLDQHLLRKCPVPTWILNEKTSANYRHILAAVELDPWHESRDDEGLSRRILELASSLAVSDFAQLHVVHVWRSITDQIMPVFSSDLPEKDRELSTERERSAHWEALETIVDRLRGRLGAEAFRYLSPRLHLRQGNPRKLIPEVADEVGADLVVMGTVSRVGVPGLLIGNTAEVVLNNIECSVLTVKPEGFVSPVALKV